MIAVVRIEFFYTIYSLYRIKNEKSLILLYAIIKIYKNPVFYEWRYHWKIFDCWKYKLLFVKTLYLMNKYIIQLKIYKAIFKKSIINKNFNKNIL